MNVLYEKVDEIMVIGPRQGLESSCGSRALGWVINRRLVLQDDVSKVV